MKSYNYYFWARRRKYIGEEDNEKKEQFDKMFPPQGCSPKDYSAYEALKEYFIPQKHTINLIHQCYKLHYCTIREVYEAYRSQFHPQITQPPLSTYYKNEAFVSMDQIMAWLRAGEEAHFPPFQKVGHPNAILTCLDRIHDQLNYVPNLQRFLFYWPDYLLKFSNHRMYLFDPKTLDPKVSYFIVLIVAIEMGCAYMISRATSSFIIHGGDKDWIRKGNFPEHIRQLFTYIHKACKAPWEITLEDFKFVKQKGWSTPDFLLYQQVIFWGIKTCTIALGVGLQPDEITPYFDLQKILDIKKKYDDIQYEKMENKAQILQQVRKHFLEKEEIDSKEMKQLQSIQIEPYMKAIGKELDEQTLYEEIHKETRGLYHSQFPKTNKRDESKYPVSCFSENNFTDKIFPQLLYFLGENFGKECQIEMSCAINQKFQDFGPDPEMVEFRKAIRYYSENLLGVKHESYNYKKLIKMNPKTSMSLRFYIRLLTLHPVYLNSTVIREIDHHPGTRIQLHDLGYIAILVADTKARIGLTQVYNNTYSQWI